MDSIHFLNVEYFFKLILDFFFNFSLRGIFGFLTPLFAFFIGLGIVLSFLFLIGIIYTYIKLKEQELVERMEEAEFHQELENVEEAEFVNKRWQKIQEHINSSSPSDWRLAILEADVALEEMLDRMSYHGETIGEKLKSVEASDFTSLDAAWEAHKVRNAIAHEGSDFLISEREAKNVINLYKQVFEEFKFI